MIKLAVPKETRLGEKRVAITPQVAGKLSSMGLELVIEHHAGQAAGFSDKLYQQHGAKITQDKQQLYKDADFVCWVKRPQDDLTEIEYLKPNSTLIGFLDPLTPGKHLNAYKQKHLTTFSWELLPKHADTKNMDALAEMSQMAGEIAYQHAQETALQKGKTQPLSVTVIGTGNAGLAAIQQAYQDQQKLIIAGTNPQTKTYLENEYQAQFILLPSARTFETEQDREKCLKLQQQKLQTALKRFPPDIIITTARRYGQAAPVLLTKECLADLPANTIIEDLAASIGGNTYYSKMDQVLTLQTGTMIRNHSNYPSQVPQEASERYADCVLALFQKLKSSGFQNSTQVLKTDPILSKASMR